VKNPKHIEAAGIQKGVAGVRVIDGERKGEGEFDSVLARGDFKRAKGVFVERVLDEILKQGLEDSILRFGGTFWCFKIAVEFDQGLGTSFEGFGWGKGFVEEALPGYLESAGKGAARVQVDGGGDWAELTKCRINPLLRAGNER
jgi:hypothetical protein